VIKRALLEDRFTQVIAGVMTSLIASGIIALWTMSVTVGRLDERLANWMKEGNNRLEYATHRIDEISRDQRDIERRVGSLEGRTRSN
jgi:hypothetical protein